MITESFARHASKRAVDLISFRMDEPRRTRLILSLGAVIAILLVAIVVKLNAPRPKPPPAPQPVAEPPPAVGPLLPAAPPVQIPPELKRADLLAAAAEAAAAFAEGRPVAEDLKMAPGRRFQLVIPFSCRGLGAAADSDPARATVDARRRTLTLVAAPQNWAKAPWLKSLLGDAEPEAVEGFWIPRPWITGEACPAVPIPQEPIDEAGPPTPPSLGLVQVFTPDGSRVGQRGSRPYRVVKKLSEEEARSAPATYRLVLWGRIAALADDQAVRCFSGGVDVRPTCLIGAELDKVRFEDAAGGETLAEWAE